MLPLLGPNNARSTAGLFPDSTVLSAKWWLVDDGPTNLGLTAAEIISIRSRLLSAGNLLNSAALDPYLLLRDFWVEFVDRGRDVVLAEATAIHALAQRIGEDFAEACRQLLACGGRVIVCGVGKSGHIGTKLAATFASTGTPAFFVHAAEASHGDLGMLREQDVVLALSYSGSSRWRLPCCTPAASMKKILHDHTRAADSASACFFASATSCQPVKIYRLFRSMPACPRPCSKSRKKGSAWLLSLARTTGFAAYLPTVTYAAPLPLTRTCAPWAYEMS